MTQSEAVAHWQNRAHAELKAAQILYEGGEAHYGAVLFHCHLALELVLKAEYIRKFDEAAPYSHDINGLAHAVRGEWNDQEKIAFEELTEFAVLARYGDEEWFDRNATQQNAVDWLKKTADFISFLLQS